MKSCTTIGKGIMIFKLNVACDVFCTLVLIINKYYIIDNIEYTNLIPIIKKIFIQSVYLLIEIRLVH